MRDTLVMVLAGGQGERLYPLTKDRAKPAVPFAGDFRLIDFTLSNCLNSGLRRIYVLTQYKSESLDQHLRTSWDVFSPEIGEWITTRPPQKRMSDDWYLGTADAIYQNVYTLQTERPRHVLVLSGDHLYRMDYSLLLEEHTRTAAHVTVACMERPLAEAAGNLGVLVVGENDAVVRLEEKPSRPAPSPGRADTCLCSMGVYAFQTEALVRSVIEDAKRSGGHDFARDVLPAMVRSGAQVHAYRFPGRYWRDVGTIDAYWEAHMDLVRVQPVLNLYGRDWPFRGETQHGGPAKIVFAGGSPGTPKAEVFNSLICHGAIVSGAYVCDSVIGPGARIEVGSRIEQSIIMDRTAIGRDVRIRRAIIDKDNTIPDGARIGYDIDWDRRHFTVSEGGVVVMPKRVPFPRADAGAHE
ncbi:MAG: glucose-1-phosphate adenylyltransferase [Candidatus Brocadiaceae bacterium]|nr:glucose-1-phosphate adenylyltransferase [Candidatus Brocadiaceae bacterium]